MTFSRATSVRQGEPLLTEDPEIDWTSRPLGELVEHLLATHHAYLNDAMPRLSELADKVAAAHVENHPELREVVLIYGRFRRDMEQHMLKEEHILFPAIQRMGEGGRFPLDGPISVMRAEHDGAARDLTFLRELTGGFVAPADACDSYKALIEGLAGLERDTLLHMHKENDILFPGALATPD